MNNEISAVLAKGPPKLTTLDPNMKDQINKSSIESVVREAKSHLLRKHKVHLILVKE
jgi:hypothetical protein